MLQATLDRIRVSMHDRILVVGANSDNLVRHSTGSETLAAKLVRLRQCKSCFGRIDSFVVTVVTMFLQAPREYLVLESGHGVNLERAHEVNQALLRLFAAVEEFDPLDTTETTTRQTSPKVQPDDSSKSQSRL